MRATGSFSIFVRPRARRLISLVVAHQHRTTGAMNDHKYMPPPLSGSRPAHTSRDFYPMARPSVEGSQLWASRRATGSHRLRCPRAGPLPKEYPPASCPDTLAVATSVSRFPATPPVWPAARQQKILLMATPAAFYSVRLPPRLEEWLNWATTVCWHRPGLEAAATWRPRSRAQERPF